MSQTLEPLGCVLGTVGKPPLSSVALKLFRKCLQLDQMGRKFERSPRLENASPARMACLKMEAA
jgi:hypothetical protein